jgi:hypothetical protein
VGIAHQNLLTVGNAYQNPLTVGNAHPTTPKIFQKSNIIPIATINYDSWELGILGISLQEE